MTSAERIVAEMLDDPSAEDAGPSPAELFHAYDADVKVGGRPMGLVPADVDESMILRVVKVRGAHGATYHLATWETGDYDSHTRIGYRFTAPGGKVLFQGRDFGCPRQIAVDSDEMLRNLLHWFLLRPGDTDEEYFKDYTPEQFEFAEGSDANVMALDYGDEDGNLLPFEDVPGFEHGDPEEGS